MQIQQSTGGIRRRKELMQKFSAENSVRTVYRVCRFIDCRRFCTKIFVSYSAVPLVIYPSLFRGCVGFLGAFIPAIAIRSCRGLPQRIVGSLDECRRARSLLGFFVLRGWQYQREPLGLRLGRREPAEHRQPRERPLRALRPSICKELLFLISYLYNYPCGIGVRF